jgi:hypothetical protein
MHEDVQEFVPDLTQRQPDRNTLLPAGPAECLAGGQAGSAVAALVWIAFGYYGGGRVANRAVRRQRGRLHDAGLMN